ncbi:hypothetical protein ACFFX0_09780 [Citricoccus parietis]|uniref:Uncharacterized protein n=1 Tax=Citricoccus parietis TaxID=592307 RepID=A0ABV5FXQ8_9MICC
MVSDRGRRGPRALLPRWLRLRWLSLHRRSGRRRWRSLHAPGPPDGR